MVWREPKVQVATFDLSALICKENRQKIPYPNIPSTTTTNPRSEEIPVSYLKCYFSSEVYYSKSDTETEKITSGFVCNFR